MACLLDRHGEQHCGKAGHDADDDGQDQKQLMLAQPQLLRAWQGALTARQPPCLRPMRTSA